MSDSIDTNEIIALRRATRDIVAISSLPSIWMRHSPSQVADSLAETLFGSLALTFAYVHIFEGENRIETAYAKSGFLSADALKDLSEGLQPLIASKASADTQFFQSVPVHLSPIGSHFKNGVLVLGAARQNFPTEMERLVLNMAKNQGHITIQHKWSHERAEKLRIRAEESEKRLREAHGAAERERHKLEAVFENSPSFLAVLQGSDFIFEKVNARFYELVGHRDLAGRKLFDALPELCSQGHLEILAHVLKTGETFVGSEMPVSLQRNLSVLLEKRYVDFIYQRITDETGTNRIIAHGIDISDKVAARRDIEVAKMEADRASELKSSFLANMSHEIRTPLGVMIGFTDLIIDPNLSFEERTQYANILKKNGEQLSVIINDILDLSKVEAGFLKIDFVEFSLKDLLEEVVANFGVRAAEKGLTLDIQADAEGKDLIVSDPVRLKQILLNLISNAIKFTHSGSIRLGCRSEGENVYFEVVDSGIGIAPHEQHKLFQPFTQADASSTRKFGGTGLGLALSKKLAQLLGGDLALKSSEPDVGSVFGLKITNRQGSAKGYPNVLAQKAAPHPPPKPTALENVRVLLVEDSPDNRKLFSRVLTKKGALVELAENGAVGVERALQGFHDIVLMDVQMPIMDGYTATQHLRDQGYRKPIIALTAHAMSEVRQKCLEVGYTDYLPKPLDFNELLRKVEKYCAVSDAAMLSLPGQAPILPLAKRRDRGSPSRDASSSLVIPGSE